MSAGFHWNHGWFFKRLDDGSIRVRQHEGANPDKAILVEFTIPPAEWASIICSVSRDGETYERWTVAQDFHGR